MNRELLIELLGILFLVLLVFNKNFKALFNVNPEIKKGTRNENYDFIRGVSIIGIVLIHIDSYFAFYHPGDTFIIFTRAISNLSRFSVPAFIISSAIFLSWSDYKKYFSGKFKSTLVPYFVIALLAYLSKYPLNNDFFTNFPTMFLFGKIMDPYYYVPLLFQFYILYAIFLKDIKTEKKMLLLALSFFINFISNHFFPKHLSILQYIEPLSFTNFIFFFAVGMVAKAQFKDSDKLQTLLDSTLISVIGFFTLICIALMVFLSFNLFTYHNHYLSYPLLCFLLLLKFSFNIKERFPNFFKYLSHVGQYSLSIFLIHPILIHFFHALDPYQMGNPLLGWIICSALNVLIPILLWKAFESIKSRIFPEQKDA